MIGNVQGFRWRVICKSARAVEKYTMLLVKKDERMATGLMLESIPLVHSMIANDGSVAAMRSVGRR